MPRVPLADRHRWQDEADPESVVLTQASFFKFKNLHQEAHVARSIAQNLLERAGATARFGPWDISVQDFIIEPRMTQLHVYNRSNQFLEGAYKSIRQLDEFAAVCKFAAGVILFGSVWSQPGKGKKVSVFPRKQLPKRKKHALVKNIKNHIRANNIALVKSKFVADNSMNIVMQSYKLCKFAADHSMNQASPVLT
jgi:hypothetical protein